MGNATAPALEALRERIVAANRARTPLRLRGGGSKDFYGECLDGDVLDTRALRGIVAYEPSELVVTALAGTPLADIESVLAEHGQFLAFEPPRFAGAATIGGAIASGLSGPRRAYAGAARDFVLGASLLDARGELLHFGGQVMKNVAGFDVSRLLCGSLGFLGMITQVSLKVLPRPRCETTLRFECDASRALALFSAWRPQPLPVSATSWSDGAACVRLSGSPNAVRSACAAVGGEVLDASAAEAWWAGLREQAHATLASAGAPLWRISLPATTPIDACGADVIEWSGALRWRRSDEPAERLRARARRCGGTAMRWRGARTAPMFDALDPVSLDLHRKLKRAFDPNGIFNPGRLVAGM